MFLKAISKIIIFFLISYTFLSLDSKLTYAQSFDINKDGQITSSDLEILSTFFGSDEREYDLNKDGIIDTVDLAILAKQINSEGNDIENPEHIFTVYKDDSNIGNFPKNNLINAIQLAAKNNGIVKLNNEVIWNNKNYFAYSNYKLKNISNSIREAVQNAYTLDNSIVVSKNGNIIYNKSLNFKKIIGVTRTSVNLRSEPRMDARTDLMIPNGTLVEVDSIVRGFYKVLYYDSNNNLNMGYVPSYLDIIQDDIHNSQLGYISAREESNGDPGAIGLHPNDKGGASFGIWQLSSKMGTVDDFLTFIKNLNREIYEMLIDAKKNDKDTFGDTFISKWKEIANNYYDEFYELQRLFIKQNYYTAFSNLASKNNLNIDILLTFNSTSNMIWSTSVQHGATGAINIFKKIPLATNIEDIIKKVYTERLKIIEKSYPPNSPNSGIVSIYNGIKIRLENERDEIIRIYTRELTY